MRQHTTPEQTARLIELGFVPETKIKGVRTVQSKVAIDCDCNFTIGELIKLLPMTITHDIWWGGCDGKGGIWTLQIQTCGTEHSWEVSYVRNSSNDLYHEGRGELIDMLYAMIVRLKEEGVI